MKKTTLRALIFAFMLVIALSLYSCDKFNPPNDDSETEAPDTEHKHSYTSEVTPPTCTEAGKTTYTCECGDSYVSDIVSASGHNYTSNVVAPSCENPGYTSHVCECGSSYTDNHKDALGHTVVTDTAVEATCTETGLTEGKHCSVCGEVTVEQKEVSPLGHNEVTDDAKEPTCTETGLTEGKHCSVCGEITVEQKEVSPLGHNEVTDNGKEPTCTEAGLTEGKHCSVCGEVTVEQKEVSALGHNEVIDPAIAPTYTTTGLTEGTHCSICDKILVAQNTIPMLPSKATLSTTTLTLNDKNISGRFSNATNEFNFMDEIIVTNNSPWVVSTDSYGMQTVATKTVPLNEGDNIFYIHVINPDQTVSTYTVNLYKNHIYTVDFNTNGGINVASRYIEEGYKVEAPTTTRVGYTFASWDYDFDTPITSNITINASWDANSDTPYKVEYYLQNLGKTGYDLVDLEENLTGTTDTVAYAEQKIFNHFTLNASESILSGNINANGNLVLKLYYTRNVYTLSNENADCGSITQSGSYTYGAVEAFKVVATVDILGYEFSGWYSDDELLSTELEYTFNIDRNVVARFAVATEMKNFYFTSDATTCSITGIKDKSIKEIVVPNYVTSISLGAFNGCSWLENITLPFVGGSKTATSASNSTLFGYIFGTSSYINTYATDQYYSSSSYTTYYIPEALKSVTIAGGNIHYGAFYNCINIWNMTIGDDVTSIGDSAFRGCRNIASIDVSDSVTAIGSYAFYGCTCLSNITIPDDVTSIGNYAFYDCGTLRSINIPRSLITMGSYAFGNCNILEKVYFNATALEDLTGDSCVFNNAGKNGFGIEVVIGKNVTKIPINLFCTDFFGSNVVSVEFETGSICESIGMNAFLSSTKLTSVHIPNSVTYIGENAFYGCISLTIYCEAKSQPEGWSLLWNSSGCPVEWGYIV